MADKVRLGLIGASVRGTWSARAHLPALRASAEVELTAVCTTRADSAEAARQAWGARLAFDDYRRMVASPEIDAVAVVVRVPSHYAPTKAALEAGKHVYCEWPLGRTTAEAVELAALAKARGLVTAVGLQARVNPAIMHMKELVEAGFVGEVMAIHVSLMREGVLSRPSNRTWQRDAALGANTLTIANGHTVDAMRFVAGDFARLSAVVATAGQAVARHRNEHPARRDLARQRAAQRTPGEWCGRLGPYRRHPVRRQRLSHGDLRQRGDPRRRGRGFAAIERGFPARRASAATPWRRCRRRSASPSPRPARPRAKPTMSARCTRCSPRRSARAKAISRISPPRSNCTTWSTPSNRRRTTVARRRSRSYGQKIIHGSFHVRLGDGDHPRLFPYAHRLARASIAGAQ